MRQHNVALLPAQLPAQTRGARAAAGYATRRCQMPICAAKCAACSPAACAHALAHVRSGGHEREQAPVRIHMRAPRRCLLGGL
jgi:hypothetical protein